MNGKNAAYKKLTRSFFRRNRLSFAVGFFSTLLSSLAMMVISYVLGSIIDTVTAADTARLSALLVFTVIALAVLTVNDLVKYRACAVFFRKATLQYHGTAFKGILSKGISAFPGKARGPTSPC